MAFKKGFLKLLTPKQKEIYKFVKRFGDKGKLTAMEIGLSFDQPRKKAEKWAKPALKELVKQKLVARNGDGYTTIRNE
jgi:hypothetical protein